MMCRDLAGHLAARSDSDQVNATKHLYTCSGRCSTTKTQDGIKSLTHTFLHNYLHLKSRVFSIETIRFMYEEVGFLKCHGVLQIEVLNGVLMVQCVIQSLHRLQSRWLESVSMNG
jgi:hypothetical protein